MAKVTTELSMSLDGYVAQPDDNPGPIFDWYNSGDVEIETAMEPLTFQVSEASARHIREGWARIGAMISGRRAPFTFVDDLDDALAKAKELAGGKDISVAGPNVIQQVINAGRMDEICVSLVPVLIGRGISFFGELVKPPVKLEGPRIIEGEGVTHLYYTVKR